jgi:hypothetical protein
MSRARDRTVRHMKQLLAVSATAAATSMISCSKDRGYAVVDPMPMPARPCFDPAKKIIVTATWSQQDSTHPGFVRVRLELAQDVTDLSFKGVKITPWLGKVLSENATDRELVVEIQSEDPTPTLRFRVDGLPCSEPETTSALDVIVDWKGTPKDKARLDAKVQSSQY